MMNDETRRQHSLCIRIFYEYGGQWYPGMDRAQVFPRFVLQRRKNPGKTSGTKGAVLPKDMSSTANSGTEVAVSLGINGCGSFPLLSVPHSLFGIWRDLKTFEKIQGAPTWRWREWIWLTGLSGLHRNSPQKLNIGSIRVFDQVTDLKIPITFALYEV